MTSTACDDQFTPMPPLNPTTRDMLDMYCVGRADTEDQIAAWLHMRGYREIAARIKAGEYRV